MSEFITDPKVNARTVVKLYRKEVNMLVSSLMKDSIINQWH